MAVRQTACRHCGQDIENFSPYRSGEWRDRGNNTHCPTPEGDAGQLHAPIPTEAQQAAIQRRHMTADPHCTCNDCIAAHMRRVTTDLIGENQ